MWREKNIYFTEHDIYFTKLMFILKNINLELQSALRTKYIFYRFLLYLFSNLVSVHQITGGDIVVGYDRTLHKFWVVVINSVYSPESKPPDQGRGQEKLWRRLVEYQVLLIL